jgi:hypothetical protein
MTKKKKRELEIGDSVKEIAPTNGKKRVGEIVSILQDNPGDPTIECVLIDANELTPIEGAMGELKRFKSKRSKLKHYTPRKNLFTKETFDIGKHISYKIGGRLKYGRIMGYLNQEEGLYPHSYDTGKYNGKDLLECVEIDTKPGLSRILDNLGEPHKFVAHPDKCKLIKVIDVDNQGNPTTKLRLDIPTQED